MTSGAGRLTGHVTQLLRCQSPPDSLSSLETPLWPSSDLRWTPQRLRWWTRVRRSACSLAVLRAARTAGRGRRSDLWRSGRPAPGGGLSNGRADRPARGNTETAVSPSARSSALCRGTSANTFRPTTSITAPLLRAVRTRRRRKRGGGGGRRHGRGGLPGTGSGSSLCTCRAPPRPTGSPLPAGGQGRYVLSLVILRSGATQDLGADAPGRSDRPLRAGRPAPRSLATLRMTSFDSKFRT